MQLFSFSRLLLNSLIISSLFQLLYSFWFYSIFLHSLIFLSRFFSSVGSLSFFFVCFLSSLPQCSTSISSTTTFYFKLRIDSLKLPFFSLFVERCDSQDVCLLLFILWRLLILSISLSLYFFFYLNIIYLWKKSFPRHILKCPLPFCLYFSPRVFLLLSISTIHSTFFSLSFSCFAI